MSCPISSIHSAQAQPCSKTKVAILSITTAISTILLIGGILSLISMQGYPLGAFNTIPQALGAGGVYTLLIGGAALVTTHILLIASYMRRRQPEAMPPESTLQSRSELDITPTLNGESSEIPEATSQRTSFSSALEDAPEISSQRTSQSHILEETSENASQRSSLSLSSEESRSVSQRASLSIISQLSMISKHRIEPSVQKFNTQYAAYFCFLMPKGFIIDGNRLIHTSDSGEREFNGYSSSEVEQAIRDLQNQGYIEHLRYGDILFESEFFPYEDDNKLFIFFRDHVSGHRLTFASREDWENAILKFQEKGFIDHRKIYEIWKDHCLAYVFNNDFEYWIEELEINQTQMYIVFEKTNYSLYSKEEFEMLKLRASDVKEKTWNESIPESFQLYLVNHALESNRCLEIPKKVRREGFYPLNLKTSLTQYPDLYLLYIRDDQGELSLPCPTFLTHEAREHFIFKYVPEDYVDYSVWDTKF